MDIQSLSLNFENSQQSLSTVMYDIILAERELQETDQYKKLQELKRKQTDYEILQKEYKENIKTIMETNGVKKIELTQCNITLKNNPSALKIFDESMIPSEYKKEKTIVEIDKASIKDDLKEGKTVMGCELTQSQSLLITPKSQ